MSMGTFTIFKIVWWTSVVEIFPQDAINRADIMFALSAKFEFILSSLIRQSITKNSIHMTKFYTLDY